MVQGTVLHVSRVWTSFSIVSTLMIEIFLVNKIVARQVVFFFPSCTDVDTSLVFAVVSIGGFVGILPVILLASSCKCCLWPLVLLYW